MVSKQLVYHPEIFVHTFRKSGSEVNLLVMMGPGPMPKELCAAAKLGGLCATKPIDVKIMTRLILKRRYY